MSNKRWNWQSDFTEAVGPLALRPELRQIRRYSHHRNVNRYDHTVRVALLSYRIARRLGLDARATARAAMLHDLFYHDRTCRPAGYHGWVVLNHPEEAAANARQITDLTPKEENIILSHMWPVSRHAPHCREAVLVNLVDDWVAVRDYFRRAST